jgi:ABC-type amino acid transport substrate-binding protein
MKAKILIISGFVFLAIFVLLSGFALDKNTNLSKEEKAWLQNHKGSVFVAAENNYPPFAFVNDQGFFSGISADYLAEIENILEIKFNISPPFHLAKNLQLLKNGEIDMITSLASTEERSQYLLFTEPYVKVPAVIVTRNDVEGVLKLKDIIGWKTGVGLDYAVHEYLLKNDPYLNLFPYEDDFQCLKKLAIGELDAVIVDIASASYLINSSC